MTGINPQARHAIEAHFHENFSLRGDLGAAFSVWVDGVEVISLAEGWRNRERSSPWTADTLVPVWSSTKGVAALTTLMALHEASLSLDHPVAEVWPEFHAPGKADITFAHLLSHRAGQCAHDEQVPIHDYAAVIHALERQPPLWPTGTQQAYHARTYGFLLDEVVRAITGADSLGSFFREVLGDPLDIDFWIGLPETEHHRVATLYPGKMNLGAGDQRFLKAYNTAQSLTQRTFASPNGLNAVQDFNRPELWYAGYPAMGGVGSARGLGKLYAILANGGKHDGVQVIPTWVQRALSTPLSTALDPVLCVPASFSAGMMMDPIDAETGRKVRQLFGPGEGSYGHPGAGGSLAGADPDNGIAFAYVMNQMEVGVLPSEKALGLVSALFL
jgi:CubicO group peptidase (beta-lactamase class C family)